MSSPTLLDASALLALLADEPGADIVEQSIDGSCISTVNWSEVLGYYAALDLALEGRRADVEALGVTFVPFTVRHATTAAALLPVTRAAGLSLADRSCLATAIDMDAAIFTADRAWRTLDLPVDVRLIR